MTPRSIWIDPVLFVVITAIPSRHNPYGQPMSVREKDGQARPPRKDTRPCAGALWVAPPSGRVRCIGIGACILYSTFGTHQSFTGPRTTRRRRTGDRASEQPSGGTFGWARICSLFALPAARAVGGRKETTIRKASLEGLRSRICVPIAGLLPRPRRGFRAEEEGSGTRVPIEDGTSSQGTRVLNPPCCRRTGGRASEQAERGGKGGGAEPAGLGRGPNVGSVSATTDACKSSLSSAVGAAAADDDGDGDDRTRRLISKGRTARFLDGRQALSTASARNLALLVRGSDTIRKVRNDCCNLLGPAAVGRGKGAC
jgi:hypothetical protein